MKIVIAPDSFKSSIEAAAAAAAIGRGVARVLPASTRVLRPMADGGEGTVEAIAAARADARRLRTTVTGAVGEATDADWLLLPGTSDAPGGTAVLELASACGIETLNGTLAPWTAHTLGLGQVIAAALDAGVSQIVVGVGSSCSTDAGVGVLTALGARFLRADGSTAPLGAIGLADIADVDLTALRELPAGGVTVLADVGNPLLGPEGAAAVFGPQKGLAPADVLVVDEALSRVASLLPVDPHTPGAGAAGGTAFGLLCWGAQIRPGAPHIAHLQSLEEAIAGADLVITGEGSFDAQSAGGKAPHHVAALAAASGTPVALVAGRIAADADVSDFVSAVSLTSLAGSAEAAIANPAAWLEAAGAEIAARLAPRPSRRVTPNPHRSTTERTDMTTLPPTDTTVATVRATINVDAPGPTISRHLYGHFAEHLGRCIYGGFYVGEDSDIPNEGGIRLDVVEALRALGIPNLRWPGGCFADEYHWTDGIGPREERPSMVNSHWGDVVEDNSFGTHEFLHLCELLGADPYISANVGSGTVREASEWIEYLTRADDSPMARLRRRNGRDEPWRVPFWGLGNEPWGCGGRFSPESYAQVATTFGVYSREHNGNRVYRIAAGASSDDYVWTDVLMRTLGYRLGAGHPHPKAGGASRAFEAISFHHYTVPGPWEHKGAATVFDEAEYYHTIREAARIERILAGHAAVMDAYDPAKETGLVLDEWGTWFDVEEGTNPGFLFQQNTVRDALVAGIHFDSFHRHADRLVMANIAQTINVLQAMILTDGQSMVLTPTYHVFEMNRGHHDAAALDVATLDEVPAVEVDGGSVPTLSLSASRAADTVLVSLTNAHATDDLEVVIDIRGAVVGAPSARLLTAPSADAHNTPSGPDTVAPRAYDGVRLDSGVLHVRMPRHSFATVSVRIGE